MVQSNGAADSFDSSVLFRNFSGSFEAAISTVNNDPVHFDNARFKPSYARPQTGTGPDELNGSFNPDGSGNWKLHGCAVTSAFLADGSPVPRTDPATEINSLLSVSSPARRTRPRMR